MIEVIVVNYVFNEYQNLVLYGEDRNVTDSNSY